MGFISQIVALLVFSNITLLSAQTTQYGSCVTACFTANPRASFCNGDETGSALDQCTCASFSGSSDPLITCVRACPEDQQLPYARHLPSLCNASLFPNLDLSGTSTTSLSSSQTVGPTSSVNDVTSTVASTIATTTAAETSTAATSTPSPTSADSGAPNIVNAGNLLKTVAGIVFLNLI